MTGDGAEYCKTCRQAQAQTGKSEDCRECEGRCPGLVASNKEAWSLLTWGQTQMRAGGFGVLGFDYIALRMVANILGLSIKPATLRKIQAVEQVILKRQGEKKDG